MHTSNFSLHNLLRNVHIIKSGHLTTSSLVGSNCIAKFKKSCTFFLANSSSSCHDIKTFSPFLELIYFHSSLVCVLQLIGWHEGGGTLGENGQEFSDSHPFSHKGTLQLPLPPAPHIPIYFNLASTIYLHTGWPRLDSPKGSTKARRKIKFI